MLNNNDTCEEGDKYCKKGRLQRAGAGESPAQGVCRNNTPEHQPEPHNLDSREDDWGRVKPAGA